MQAADKRSFPRCAVPSLAPHPDSLDAHAPAHVARVYTLDLSRSGMRFVRLRAAASKDEVAPARVYPVAVPLTGTPHVVHALAETVRSETRGPLEEVAVRFRYLAPEDQRCLDAYLCARG